jgi:hypothetical protein
MRRREFLLSVGAPAVLAGSWQSGPAPATSCRASAWVTLEEGQQPELKWEATVQGRNAKILRVRPPDDPMILLVVLDLTGDLTLVEPAREAAASALNALPGNTWVALLRAQNGLQTIVDPTADRAVVIEGIRSQPVSGPAGLLDSVEPAARLASAMLQKSPVRLATLYLTDSNIFNYREDYTNPVINYSDTRDLSRRFPEALIREKTSKLANALAASAAPLFVVHLAFLRDRLNEAYQTGLRQMSEASGGEALFCRSVAEIPTSVDGAFRKISTHWAIDIELPPGTPKQFSVALSAGGAPIRARASFALPKK